MLGITSEPFELTSKSQAIHYAISMSTHRDKNDKLNIDLVLASGIYDFITKRVNLPDVTRNMLEETVDPLIDSIKKALEKLDRATEKEVD